MEPHECLHRLFERSVHDNPEQIAVVQGAVRTSYGRLNEMADRVAASFTAQGIGIGDRVALAMENSVEFISAYFGTLKCGAVTVPLNPANSAEGMSAIMRDVRPQALLCSPKAFAAATAALPDTVRLVCCSGSVSGPTGSAPQTITFAELLSGAPTTANASFGDPAGLAAIIYTSGSTGTPKGVMLSHANLCANTRSIIEYLHIDARDIQMVVLPFYYVMGLSLLNTHLASGARLILNNSFAFPAAVLNQMIAEKVTAFSGVPSTYAFLLHRSPLKTFRDRLTSLRYCSQAGGHMPAQVKKELRAVLPDHTAIVIMYGATEASARLSWLDPAFFESRMGSIGVPIPGVDMRILDEEGSEVPRGVEGELVARGANIMQGYWGDEELTRKVLDRNGYHTGDRGYQDSDGFFFVTGRNDAVIKVGGHRVNPQEIEDALMESGLLMEITVQPLADPLLGSRLVALAVPVDAQLRREQVLRFAATALPRHKIPAEVVFTPSLPKNSHGKLDRRMCVEQITTALAPSA